MHKPPIFVVYYINHSEDPVSVEFLEYFFSAKEAYLYIKECVKSMTHPLEMEFLVGDDEKEYYEQMSSPFGVGIL